MSKELERSAKSGRRDKLGKRHSKLGYARRSRGISVRCEKLAIPCVGIVTQHRQRRPRGVFIAKQFQPRSQELATGNSLGSESGLKPRGRERSEGSSFRYRTNASHGDSEDICPHHHFDSDRT
jgi:hypothetical protein